MSSRAVLVCEALSKHIGSRVVLSDVAFSLSAGGILAIVGDNGQGKSTLLRVIAGVLTPSGGRLVRFGEVVGQDSRGDPRIGFIGHESFLYGVLTLEENLLLYGRLWGVSHLSERISSAIKQVGLHYSRHDLISRYSRGMTQRAALARLLVQRPALWLLDEPFSGLDWAGREMLKNLLREVSGCGAAILITSPRAADEADAADVTAVLEWGRLVRWRGHAPNGAWVSCAPGAMV